MKTFTAALLSVVASHEVIIYEDFVPYQKNSFNDHSHTVFDMEIAHNDKMAHRETQEYKDFIEGPMVTAFHAIALPIVEQAEETTDMGIAPWGQNLLRHTIRQRFRFACWFVGLYQLMFTNSVQLYYNCSSYLDLDWLAYSTTYCIIFMCEKPTQLWDGSEAFY